LPPPPRGKDWYVTWRDINGRVYYNLVLVPGRRGQTEIFEEAALKIHQWLSQLPNAKLMVSLTVFLGRAKERGGKKVWPKVVLLVGRAGIAVQIPSPVIIGRVWDLLEAAKRVNEKISPYDFRESGGGSDDAKEYDDFNLPDVDDVA
jgi:hypothetical protein